jgi:hypothetical protein
MFWEEDSVSFVRGRSGFGPRGPQSGPLDNDNAVPDFGTLPLLTTLETLWEYSKSGYMF